MSPIYLIQFAIFSFCCQNRSEGKCISQKFSRNDLFMNTTITELSIYSKSEYKSALECFVTCSRLKECVSFFYNARSGLCTGHAVQFYSTELGSPDEGSLYYTRPIGHGQGRLTRLLWSSGQIKKRSEVRAISFGLISMRLEILKHNPGSTDGVYDINPLDVPRHFRVYCDMTTDGGGWTVFQRRRDGSEDFFRNWTDYKIGFGALEGDFWLGNDNIYLLTTRRSVQLRINLGDYDNQSRYAKYSTFRFENEANSYRLTVSGYSGDAGDSMAFHNGLEFTTKDRDNDKILNQNCAVLWTGAWWYNDCFRAHLNGRYGDNTPGKGINWVQWRGWNYSLKWTEMMMKPI